MSNQKRKSQKPSTRSELSDLTEAARKADAPSVKAGEAAPLRFGVLQGEPEAELGIRLQVARQAAGLTQGQLSKQLAHADKEGRGVSAAVISLYERGVNKPGPKELRLLCEALRVTPNFLLYGNEDPFQGRTELSRYGGVAKSEVEFLAYLTYCFSRLHKHHREGMLQIMLGLLRGWNNSFDDEMHEKAVDTFLSSAKELKKLLHERDK